MLKYTKLSAIFGNENFFGVLYQFGEKLEIKPFTDKGSRYNEKIIGFGYCIMLNCDNSHWVSNGIF